MTAIGREPKPAHGCAARQRRDDQRLGASLPIGLQQC
jgi:hypothetical protein